MLIDLGVQFFTLPQSWRAAGWKESSFLRENDVSSGRFITPILDERISQKLVVESPTVSPRFYKFSKA